MRYLISFSVIFFLLILLIGGCDKDEELLDDAVITGYDYRECACCGGLIVNFEGSTETFPDNFFLIRNKPGDTNIGPESEFPIFVHMEWSIVKDMCGDDTFIDVHELRRQ